MSQATMRGLSRERLQRTRTIRRFDRMAEPGQEVSSPTGSAFQMGRFMTRLAIPMGELAQRVSVALPCGLQAPR